MVFIRAHILLLSFAFALLQCSAPRPLEPTPLPASETTTQQDDALPVVLTALLKVKAGAPVLFSLENTIRAEGLLKEKADLSKSRQPEEGFVLSIVDESGAVLAVSYLGPDPLKKRLEYAEEDGTMHSKEVMQEEDWIAIRVQDPHKKLILRVEQVQQGKAARIIDIPIPEG